MKTKDILSLVVLGVIAWFFLKPKKVLAEEVKEKIPTNEIVTKPIIDSVKIKRIIAERPCYLTDYPCIQWYRTQYKIWP